VEGRGFALVTGATGGIGRAAVFALAGAGFEVFATGRNEQALAAVEADGAARGLKLAGLRLDVTDATSIDACRAEVDRRTGGRGIDVLVNNAGYGQFGPIEELSDADLRGQFDVNVFGVVAVTRAFLPAMRARGSGRIVNVSSLSGLFTMPLMGAYHATKYAVEALSDALRREVGGCGVRVCLIEPGMIRTGFEERTIRERERYGAAGSPYATAMERFARVTGFLYRRSPDARVPVAMILKAATSRFPRARYAAPLLDRIAIALGRMMPTRLMDWMFRKVFGLPRADQ
jgi:NAD(P)-dependent dehydrogenase (short-subunit alcohol dehydrogenase family)